MSLTRTTGLPHARDDIGHWGEPAGIVARWLEAALVGLNLARLRLATPAQPSAATSHWLRPEGNR